MKCAIFGTGKYYERYKKYIDGDDVLFLLDNDESKWGKIIDGKEVLSPKRVNYDACEVVLIMIMQYEKIEEQLVEYGVARDKIKNCHDIPDLYNLTADVVCYDGKTSFESWKRSHPGKSIFVCSPEFSRTGVPIALMHVCKMFKTMGYEVLISALMGGTLEEELSENGIDYFSDLGLFYKKNFFLKTVQEFDLIFLGGIGTSELGFVVSRYDLPIVWWLHESDDKYYEKYKLVMCDNIHYFAGGKRVVDKFYKFYRNGKIREMLYFLPKADNLKVVQEHQETITFAVIGSIIRRKGQDIFIQAIKQLSKENLNGVNFLMVGSYDSAENFSVLNEQVEKIENLELMDELSQKELNDFYKGIDVLVCPSRDDPMPIVVTQAFQNGIPCIVSDQVGQCEYLIDGKGGDVFQSEDISGLRDAMSKYIKDRDLSKKKGKEAKAIFVKHFSEDAMRKNLETIISDLM